MKPNKIALLIDGDVIAYRAAAVGETKQVKCTHISSGRSKLFGTRTEFKDALKEKNFEYNPEDWNIEDIQTPLDISICYSLMKKQIQGFKSDLFADLTEVFVSGKNNFRDSLPLPYKYKGHRDGMIRPIHLRNCKKFLVENYNAKISNGFESDDYLVIRGYHYLSKGYTPVMITVDKDANAYSGLSLFDFTKEPREIKLIPEMGSLYLDEKGKVRGYGFIWFCFQMIRGDVGDNFIPYTLANVKFGEKAAYKVLKDCSTEKEALLHVINQYKIWYPLEFTYKSWDGQEIKADWFYMMQLYYRCVKMKKTQDDSLDLLELFKEKGIKDGV